MPCGSPHQCSLRLGHQKTSKEPKTQHQLPGHVFTLKSPFWHFLRQRVAFYCCSLDYESKNLFVMCHLQAEMNMYVSPNCQFFLPSFAPVFTLLMKICHCQKHQMACLFKRTVRLVCVFFTPVFVNVIPYPRSRVRFFICRPALRSPPSHLSSQRQSLRLNERRRLVFRVG